ncbi:Pentatricopeptide repeat-containing protein At2g31400 [Durusdinium trenchii]|uniref:Chloroplastic n=1 Tax=Durusdinium trenchii TaxID=1381693 RepID=A0ABP0I3S3_9DINO
MRLQQSWQITYTEPVEWSQERASFSPRHAWTHEEGDAERCDVPLLAARKRLPLEQVCAKVKRLAEVEERARHPPIAPTGISDGPADADEGRIRLRSHMNGRSASEPAHQRGWFYPFDNGSCLKRHSTDGVADAAESELLMDSFVSFCWGKPDMSNRDFLRLCRDCHLLNRRFTALDADLLFTKVLPKMQRRLKFEDFEVALRDLAERKGVTMSAIRQAIAFAHGPFVQATEAESIRLHDDISSYTGETWVTRGETWVTWDRGGPDPNAGGTEKTAEQMEELYKAFPQHDFHALGWQAELQRFLTTWADRRTAPSLAFGTAVVAAMGRAQAVSEAFQFGRCLRDEGLEVDTFFCNNLLQACSSTNRWDLPLFVLSEMLQLGPPLDLASLGLVAKELPWPRAVRLLQLLPLAALQPNVVLQGAVIAQCERAGRWEVALDLLTTMKGQKLLPNVVSCSSAISACEKGGEWRAALAILEEMRQGMLRADLIAFSACISACGKGGQWTRAMWLLSQMQREQLPPNVIVYNAVLNALAQQPGGAWAQVFELLRRVQQLRSRESRDAELETFSCALRALGRQRWRESLALWSQLQGSCQAGVPHASIRLIESWPFGNEDVSGKGPEM